MRERLLGSTLSTIRIALIQQRQAEVRSDMNFPKFFTPWDWYNNLTLNIIPQVSYDQLKKDDFFDTILQ
jgi:hypothetical protein